MYWQTSMRTPEAWTYDYIHLIQSHQRGAISTISKYSPCSLLDAQVAVGEDGLMRGCERPAPRPGVAALVMRILDGGRPLDEAEITFLFSARGADLEVGSLLLAPCLPGCCRQRIQIDVSCGGTPHARQ